MIRVQNLFLGLIVGCGVETHQEDAMLASGISLRAPCQRSLVVVNPRKPSCKSGREFSLEASFPRRMIGRRGDAVKVLRHRYSSLHSCL